MRPIFVLMFGAMALLITSASCKNRAAEQSGQDLSSSLGRPIDEAALQLDAEPDRLNPVLSTSLYSRIVHQGIFLYLLYVDPESLELIPQLAKARPEVEEITEGPFQGGLAYTFEIHEEAVWENGSPVTGHDYAFTLKTALNPKVPAPAYRAYLSFIKDVEVSADNPRKFTVYTNQKYILGEEAVSSTLPILPAYHYDPDGLLKDIPFRQLADEEQAKELEKTDERLQQFADRFTSPRYSREKEGISGCGPYRFEEWVTGQRVVLIKKEEYWGDALAEAYPALAGHPERLAFRPIPDAAAAITALKDAQVDAMANIPAKSFEELKDNELASSQYNFYTPQLLAQSFVYVNTRNPKLSDKRVRQALAYAIDVSEIIETVYYGYASPTAGPVPSSFSYYNEDVKPIPYQPERARSLLAEAGWEDTNNNGIVDKEINGVREELRLKYIIPGGRETSQNVALLMQESMRKAGIGLELENQEFSVMLEGLRRGEFELAAAGQSVAPSLWEPKQRFHTTEGNNVTGFGNAETDAMIDQIQVTLDEQKRDELYKKLQAAIYDEMPIIYIMTPTNRLAIHKRFEVELSPMFPGYIPAQLKLREEAELLQ